MRHRTPIAAVTVAAAAALLAASLSDSARSSMDVETLRYAGEHEGASLWLAGERRPGRLPARLRRQRRLGRNVRGSGRAHRYQRADLDIRRRARRAPCAGGMHRGLGECVRRSADRSRLVCARMVV